MKVAKTVGADETLTADIVVVGAGASGTAAAVTAAEAGAKVIVLEKGPAVGGAGKLASGLFAVESSMQKAKYDQAFGIAVVLLLIVLAINGLAKYLSHKFNKSLY